MSLDKSHLTSNILGFFIDTHGFVEKMIFSMMYNNHDCWFNSFSLYAFWSQILIIISPWNYLLLQKKEMKNRIFKAVKLPEYI